ncbi:MAG: tetratricopeptide repeat protein [Acholeplasmataceae bacterium]
MNARKHYRAGLAHYILDVSVKNVVLAREHFERAAELGYADANYFLGRMFLLGDGVSKDEKKAVTYFQEGRTSNKCGYGLGLAYRGGLGLEKDEKKADKLFEKHYPDLLEEAKENDVVSMHLVGSCCYYGHGVKASILKAIEWFQQAASAGYADSLYMLGLIQETVDQENPRTERAIEYYEKAAEQGHPYAEYALATIYHERQDWTKAVRYYERAAKQNYDRAAFALAMHYREHEPKKPDKAYAWFLSAAKQGHREAEYYAGLYNQLGRGTTKNIRQAVFWYERAALKKEKNALYHLALILMNDQKKPDSYIRRLLEQAAVLEHPHAQYNLAVMYQKGDGVEQDLRKAFLWYQKAAEADLDIAQYNLGMLYLQGLGTEKDVKKARIFLEKAAEQGLEVAEEMLHTIGNYDTLTKSPWQP